MLVSSPPGVTNALLEAQIERRAFHMTPDLELPPALLIALRHKCGFSFHPRAALMAPNSSMGSVCAADPRVQLAVPFPERPLRPPCVLNDSKSTHNSTRGIDDGKASCATRPSA